MNVEDLRSKFRIVDDGPATKPAELPQLLVRRFDLVATARDLRDLFAKSGLFFDRGMVAVQIAPSADGGPPATLRLNVHSVCAAAHSLSRPVKPRAKGDTVPDTLPQRVAALYLEGLVGEWNLPPLAGVTTAPILSDDGGIRTATGYDAQTQLWAADMPAVRVKDRPTRADAETALKMLREALCTFPFADAAREPADTPGLEVVKLSEPPGMDESCALAGLLTAICRPSLWLSPGLLITAPALSGSATGKGLLAQSFCTISFGNKARAFTGGSERNELDKRLVGMLLGGAPALLLDNLNGVALKSDTLASVMTERPSVVRVMGTSDMLPVNSAAFICVTGNGLTTSEDLARRFVLVQLDAKMEDPEARPFAPGFLDTVRKNRAHLLSLALTVFRWGRQYPQPAGRPLGNYEDWSRWVRDPLLGLGCKDVVERIQAAKAADPQRTSTVAIFEEWFTQHGDAPVTASGLAASVKELVDPHQRGRQYVARALQKLAGTRVGSFHLSRQDPAGTWNAATYRVQRTEPDQKVPGL